MSELEPPGFETDVLPHLERMSADDFMAWFQAGFRNLASDDDTEPPFGEFYAFMHQGEDITDDLASFYGELSAAARNQYEKGLVGACRSFDARDRHEQRALVPLLRLGAKIQCHSLLPLLARKIFVDASPDDVHGMRLRSLALDVAVELAGKSADPVAHLLDIVHSKMFRASAAAAVLFVLCEHAGSDLLAHLYRLEDQLVDVYGDAVVDPDDGLRRRRALLVADLAEFAMPHVIGGTVEYSLRNRDWRLAWFGQALFDDSLLASLPEDESHAALRLRRKIDEMQDDLPRQTKPDWAAVTTSKAPDLEERRIAGLALDDEELNAEGQEEVYRVLVGKGLLHREDVTVQTKEALRNLIEDAELHG